MNLINSQHLKSILNKNTDDNNLCFFINIKLKNLSLLNFFFLHNIQSIVFINSQNSAMIVL
ncbi:hypothetical protein HMPREF0798_00355 [Staphylococcus hominis subsp. hominis C80]|nr:hypothetical protein HMPREF0798_00355 [Staphylococcus hominis subsp. hominis C80]